MIMTGQVINVSEETREMTSKDGASKRTAKIKHVLLMCPGSNGGVEVVNLRAYDQDWDLPKIGDKSWSTPRIRKYECYDGNVAEVMV